MRSQEDGCHISALKSNTWICEVWSFCFTTEAVASARWTGYAGALGSAPQQGEGRAYGDISRTKLCSPKCNEATANVQVVTQHELTVLGLSHFQGDSVFPGVSITSCDSKLQKSTTHSLKKPSLLCLAHWSSNFIVHPSCVYWFSLQCCSIFWLAVLHSSYSVPLWFSKCLGFLSKYKSLFSLLVEQLLHSLKMFCCFLCPTYITTSSLKRRAQTAQNAQDVNSARL